LRIGKKFLLLLSIVLILVLIDINSSSISQEKKIEEDEINDIWYEYPNEAPVELYDPLESVLNKKLQDYEDLGYFPNIYESSLGATYYGLYILDVLGRLDDYVDRTLITRYIMSHYNYSSHSFTDKYTLRYLDTDFDQEYYPFNTLLETTCYAILSLEILGRIDLIDPQNSRDFIWSCFNSETGGFCGCPYNECPNADFRTATIDNSYYAIITLNILNENWDFFTNQINDLVSFISTLQYIGSWPQNGGFANELGWPFSFRYGFEGIGISLLSTYQAVSILNYFSRLAEIDMVNLSDYMDNCYEETLDFFKISAAITPYYENIASSLGLQISNIINYLSPTQETEVINFLLNAQDDMGLWNLYNSTHSELMYTFIVARALKEVGKIYILAPEADKMTNSLSNFYHYDSFTNIMQNYTT